jgi:hypothetical protein
MATQYTSILKLALPTQGELSGTWGDVVNDNITSMVEEAIAGRSVINSWAANSHTLTTADGLTSESRAAMLEFTDTGTALSGAATVICPTATKIYVCKNGAGQTVTVKTAAGTGVAIPNGETMFVFCDGTNVVQAVTSLTTLKVGTGIQVSTILDEDNMASDSATALATQQSIKAYVDAQITAQDLDFAGDTGTGAVDLDSQTFTVAGTANEIETSASGQTITIGLPTAIVVTTITTTNVQATNIKANDGTAAITIADSTGQVTVTDAVLTTADINGGTADNVTIGGSTAAAGSFTTLGASGTTTLSGALALTGNLDINTNKFNVTAVDGNTLIAGTLGVTGNVDLNGGAIDGTVIGGSTAAAVTGTTIVANTSIEIAGTTTVSSILDEDNMASDSDTALATQQSIKAYVDSQVGTVDTLAEILANGNTSGATDLVIDSGQVLTTNTINETTAASGVTIDSVLLKDDGVNATNLEITNLKANDGTSAGSIADSTGVVTLASSVLTTTDINGGTIDGTVIGGTTPAAVTTSSLVATTADINAGTIDGTVIGGSSAAAGTFTTGQFNTSLNVTGTATADKVTIGTSSASNGKLTLEGVDGADSAGIYFNNTTAANGKSYSLSSGNSGEFMLYDRTSSAYRLFVSSAGNVGINVSSPTSPLHVRSAANVNVRFDDSGSSSYTWYMNDAQNLYIPNVQLASTHTFYANGQRKVDINSSGNVGIGTSSPATTLDVAGVASTFGLTVLGGGAATGYIGKITNNSGAAGGRDGLKVETILSDSTTKILTATSNSVDRFVVTGTGNVGINETVPFGKLHISDTQTGRTTAGSVGNLLVLEDDENGMSILSADAGAGYILFGDTASASSGGISYEHSANKFNFRTNDAWNRMILDSSGNLLVGKTTTAFGTQGIRLEGSNGKIEATRNGNIVMALNRLTSDGTIAEFAKDGTTVGSIFNSGTTMGVGSLDTGVLLANNIDAILPWNASTNAERDNAIDLGRSGGRFKDLYLSGNAYVGNAVTSSTDGSSDLKLEGNQHIFRRGSAGSYAEKARIDSSGNLLVGDTSTVPFDGTSGVLIGGARTSLAFATTGHTHKMLYSVNTGTAGLHFYDSTNNRTDMIWDNSGNLLVGTTSASSYRLAAVGLLPAHFTADSAAISPTYGGVVFYRPTKTSGNGNGFAFNLDDFDDTEVEYGYIGAIISGNTVGAQSGDLLFAPMSSGTRTERMRLDSSGNLLVGRSSAGAAATDNGHVFYGSGQHYIFSNATECVRFYETSGSGQQVGSISITSSATAFNTSSDERLKENITDAPAGNIDDIKVRSFDWKADGSHQDYGMVAQELEAVAPYAVTKGETEDDMWSVDYSKLVPMLIKEIQDLKAEVAALKGAN